MASAVLQQAKIEGWTDEQVIERVLAGETAAFEILMRRHNQRIYRAALAITRNDAEAEDVMQDAYVRAFQHLGQFSGRAQFSTWLTRIAVHEALARNRKNGRSESLDAITEATGDSIMPSDSADPETQASTAEMTRVLEQAMLALPDSYRAVIMLRDIEEMSTAEAAEVLDITEENLKVRLHRARSLLREELYTRVGTGKAQAFPFLAPRCDRVVQRVFERLAEIGNVRR